MKIDLRNVLSPRAMFGAVLIAVALLILTFVWIIWTAPPPPVAGNIIAIQTVIPAPTGTPINLPTQTPVPITPTLDPNQIAVGVYVQISGTGGDGLRIRSAPGLTSAQLFLGLDSEVFTVQEGPRELDGYTWWYIIAPYDQARAGWAASNFLKVVPPPSQ
jgi:hypothetical protein